MGRVVELQTRRAPEAPQDDEVIARFQRWWPNASAKVRRAITRIVAAEAEQSHDEAAREVLEFLNSRRPGKRGFRPVEANLAPIRARLASGLTPDELRQIVALKARQVREGTFDAKYLRPVTLFNLTRCEQYLGELGAGP